MSPPPSAGPAHRLLCCLRPPNPDEQASRRRSRKIDRQLKNDRLRMRTQVKLLLLGAGESGKSTFLKQMKIIHGVVFEPEQLKEFRRVIYRNLIRGMRVLVDANRKLGLPLYDEGRNRLYGDQLLLFDDVNSVDQHNFGDFKDMLLSLWTDPGIRQAFERRSEFQLTDSMEYFFEHVERVSRPTYVPTQQDILFCRKTTKGIHEFPLEIGPVTFLFVDVGGQRTQRQKWFQCFDSVTAILFLASASEFDQVLLEDRSVNRLEEARSVFDTIVNNRIFAKVSFILFLNKMDLLAHKVEQKRVDISKYFPEEWQDTSQVRKYVKKFGGDPLNLEDVKAFVLYLFVTQQRSHTTADAALYHHFTTAVDTRNIQFVFNSVKETILRRNLGEIMLQ